MNKQSDTLHKMHQLHVQLIHFFKNKQKLSERSGWDGLKPIK